VEREYDKTTRRVSQEMKVAAAAIKNVQGGGRLKVRILHGKRSKKSNTLGSIGIRDTADTQQVAKRAYKSIEGKCSFQPEPKPKHGEHAA